MADLAKSARAVRTAIDDAACGLVEREALVELVALSAVAREHLLVVGPPGTAKSEAVRRVARRLGGRYFEYLLGRFTEPSELFGPVSFAKLKEGVVETETSGMLPEAEIAFLDEVFLGSTAILNTLLGILNERTFRRGRTPIACPLRVCVGASNRLPGGEGGEEPLAAFADRFLVRAFVAPVGDSRVEELLAGAWSIAGKDAPSPLASVEDLDALAEAARASDPTGVRSALAHAIRKLRAAGVELTDRRAARLQGLVAAASVLAGRERPTDADLWPVVFAVPTEAGQRIARDVLRDLLERSENAALSAAAADGSLGPLARATRLVRAADELLAREGGEAEAYGLEVEALLREIDASFTRAALPEALVGARARLVAVLV